MQTVVYDGTFDGWLCAVFDIYEYRFADVTICPEHRFLGNVFQKVHHARMDQQHSERVRKGLEKKLSSDAFKQLSRTFLSELPGIEDVLLQYVQYVFKSDVSIETDFSHPAVLTVVQTAKKVWKEMHRMQAFVRFQKTADGLFYAVIEPDHNVLPLIADHFEARYADQKWMIYDVKRKYGIFYDLKTVQHITIQFSEEAGQGKNIGSVYDIHEASYQELWQQYFKSVNIAARKNTKLHIQQMPRRYWKYMPEKR